MIFSSLPLPFSVCFWVFLNFTKYVHSYPESPTLSLSIYLLVRLFNCSPFSWFGFFQAVTELADPDLGCCRKNEETSLDLKRRGNLCFRSRDFGDALLFYSKSLRFAPLHAIDGDKSLLASLFLNRANVLHVSLSLYFLQFLLESLSFILFDFFQ